MWERKTWSAMSTCTRPHCTYESLELVMTNYTHVWGEGMDICTGQLVDEDDDDDTDPWADTYNNHQYCVISDMLYVDMETMHVIARDEVLNRGWTCTIENK